MIDFRFRRAEVIICSIYLFFGIIAAASIGLNSLDPDRIWVFLILGFISFLSCIVEHKIQLIFNREANKFTIVEKALFRNEYKVNKQLSLDDITGATVHSYVSRRKNGSTRMYELHIGSATEGTILPLCCASSNSSMAVNSANKINAFLAGSEPSLIINHAPFAFRLVGSFFSVLYFLLCYSMCVR